MCVVIASTCEILVFSFSILCYTTKCLWNNVGRVSPTTRSCWISRLLPFWHLDACVELPLLKKKIKIKIKFLSIISIQCLFWTPVVSRIGWFGTLDLAHEPTVDYRCSLSSQTVVSNHLTEECVSHMRSPRRKMPFLTHHHLQFLGFTISRMTHKDRGLNVQESSVS